MVVVSFLKKHKRLIIFWIIFLFILFYFTPRQSNYYLDNDIKKFKDLYMFRISIWIWCILMGLLLIPLYKYFESIKQSLKGLSYMAIMIAFHLFVFQNILLSTVLFINRQIKSEIITRTYVARYYLGEKKSKENFNLTDLSFREGIQDKKLINRVYKQGINDGDTLVIQFDKGLFGIAFSKQPFDDE